MKPVKQTILNGTRGNCLAACMASIYDLRLEDVPNFVLQKGPAWWDSTIEFMETRGHWPLVIDALTWTETKRVPFGYHIMTGPGPRGFEHAVIGLNGEIAHDPHPSGEGLLETHEYLLFVALLTGESDG